MSRLVTAVLLCSCCAVLLLPLFAVADDAEEASAPTPLCRVYATAPDATWAGSGLLRWDDFLARLGAADVVILGEYHDDPASHAMELELLTRMVAANGVMQRLSMEMFERDVQPLLDQYLSGQISEEQFLAQSRPWSNYPTDYRPLIELCKANSVRVIGANSPTELARRVAHQGAEAALAGMTEQERGWVAEQTTAPEDAYYENFVYTMTGGGHGGMQMDEAVVRQFYQAQCLKDDTMAEAIVAALDCCCAKVLQVNGSFHCDYKLGTAARVAQRLPAERRLVVVALRPVPGWSWASIKTEGMFLNPGDDENPPSLPVADFVVFVPAPDFGQTIPAVPPTPEPDATEGAGDAALPPVAGK
jgi:uncharacterized iron-regulated protein